MTKKSNNPRPSATKQNERVINANTTSLSEVKKFSRWKTVDVKLETLKDGNHQGFLIGDGIPYPFWTHVYQNFEMKPSHADEVRKRLIPEKHIISLSKEEMKQIYPVIHDAWMIRNFPSVYYFLTHEGTNRLLIEVDTSGMKDRDVADKIEKRKDEMVNIFTRYEKGEVLSLKGETQKHLPKFVPGAGILRDRLRQAHTYERYIGCSKKESILICLKIADEDHKRLGGSGFEALITKAESMPDDKKRLLPAQPGLYISVTKIGKMLGVSGQQINKHLDKLGYQESAGSEHTPTDIGIPYAKWEEITISKNDGSQSIKPHLIWSVEIIDILRVHIEAEQATLPGCESV